MAIWDAFPFTAALSALFGAAAGFGSATFQEQLRRKKRFHALAAALDVERRRIADELQALRADPGDYAEVRVQAPSVHRWLERVIVDSSELDPRLVAEFLLLERILHNTGVYLEASAKAQRHTSNLHASIERAVAAGEARAVADGRQALMPVEQRRALARAELDRSMNAALLSLSAIEQLLRPYLRDRFRSQRT
ncbi:MAG: hypothetical protein Q8R02_14980 [Hyphomonadaceae bacterium]|nr:hypothetical protein [Hyphomonadaceae bacterium]